MKVFKFQQFEQVAVYVEVEAENVDEAWEMVERGEGMEVGREFWRSMSRDGRIVKELDFRLVSSREKK